MKRLIPRAAAGGVAAGALAAIVCWPCAAHAAGFASARFGGEQGSVVATNPTALYFNPAGIGFSERTHVYLDGELALRHATYVHPAAPSDPIERPGTEGANVGSARLFNVFGGPALGATTRIGNFAFGVGVFVPFGGRATWDVSNHFSNAKYPLASAGVQRWHIIDGALTELYLTAGAAYRLGPLSLGIAGNFINGSAQTTEAKTIKGDVDTTREGRATLDVSANTASLAAGAMLEAVPKRLWLGASYQSQPGLGPQTMKGTLAVTYAGSMSTSLPVNFTQALPDIVRAGVRWRPSDDGELRVFGDYTRWSVMKTQCIALQNSPCQVYPDGSDPTASKDAVVQGNIQRYFHDTFGIRLGGSYWASPGLEFFAGAGFETAAVPDATLEPGLMDADNVAVALGGRFLVADWFYLAASYTQIEFLNRNNIGKSTLAAAKYPTQQQDAGGIYTQWIGIFDLNVERQF